MRNICSVSNPAGSTNGAAPPAAPPTPAAAAVVVVVLGDFGREDADADEGAEPDAALVVVPVSFHAIVVEDTKTFFTLVRVDVAVMAGPGLLGPPFIAVDLLLLLLASSRDPADIDGGVMDWYGLWL